MLPEHSKAIIKDLRGKRDVELEVNFSSDPIMKDCVQLTVGSEKVIIPLRDIHGFMMVVGNPDQQADLVPVTQTTVKKLIKMHRVEVTKDIKKGDFLNVRCETNVPIEVYNGTMAEIHQANKGSRFLPGIIK